MKQLCRFLQVRPVSCGRVGFILTRDEQECLWALLSDLPPENIYKVLSNSIIRYSSTSCYHQLFWTRDTNCIRWVENCLVIMRPTMLISDVTGEFLSEHRFDFDFCIRRNFHIGMVVGHHHFHLGSYSLRSNQYHLRWGHQCRRNTVSYRSGYDPSNLQCV